MAELVLSFRVPEGKSHRKPISLTDPYKLTKHSLYPTGDTSEVHEVIITCSNDTEKAVISHHTC